MMACGIYLINNKINGKKYVGQSRNIEKRWKNHKSNAYNTKDDSYEYPLYRAFRKYGVENFDFSIIEECDDTALNQRENYWICFYGCNNAKHGYNQTSGFDYQLHPCVLTLEDVNEIQQLLLEYDNNDFTHADIATKFNVGICTITDINVGRAWKNSKYRYPLHISKYSTPHSAVNSLCPICGNKKDRQAKHCNSCANKLKTSMPPISRSELKQLLRQYSFCEIGKQNSVSDNAVRRWCKKYSLP